MYIIHIYVHNLYIADFGPLSKFFNSLANSLS